MTAQAHQERLNHWSMVALLSSWRILKCPWRRLLANREAGRDEQERVATRNLEADLEEPSGEEHVVVLATPYDWTVSGDGWMWGQDEESVRSTHYWSSGTAMETDSDSSFSSDGSIDAGEETLLKADSGSLPFQVMTPDPEEALLGEILVEKRLPFGLQIRSFLKTLRA